MPHFAKVVPTKDEDEHSLGSNATDTPKAQEIGPVTKRSFTDGICCFYLSLLMVAFIACVIYTLMVSEYKYVGRVYDSDGKLCGVDSGYEDYPYLYYPIPSTKYTTKTVCAKSCPVSPLVTNINGLYKTNSVFTNTVATSNDVTVIKAALDSGLSLTGSFFVYETFTFANRICIAKKSGTTFTPVNNDIMDLDIFAQWISDIRETYIVIGGSILVSLGIGLMYTFLMRYQSGLMFILCLFFMLGALGGTGILLTSVEDTAQSNIAKATDQLDTSIISKNNLAKKAVAFVSWGVLGLVYLSLLLVFRELIMANKVIKTASEYVRKTWAVFPFSIGITIILIIFFGVWSLATYVLLGWEDITNIKITPFGESPDDVKDRFIFIFYVFVFFVVSRFIYGFAQLIIASSTCHWYFSQGVRQQTSSNILASMKRVIRYHIGSVVAGSLILTSLAPLKVIFYLIGPNPYKPETNQNKLTWLTCKCSCMLSFKRFLAKLDDSAYIQIALSGKTFYDSAEDSFALTARNYEKMKSLKGIGSQHAFYGQVLIASVAGALTTIYLTFMDSTSLKTFSPVLTIILAFFFAFMIGGIFMTIYGTVIDTLVMCFIIEEERYINHNIPFKHCPKSLKLLAFKVHRETKVVAENLENL